jgi:hypothetical protein
MSDVLAPQSALHAARALLAIEEEEALETAIASVSPSIAARAVVAAPTLERKTTLLWAMDDRQRREALDLVPPALLGALVQNLEDDNRYLLGDFSLDQFRSLLSLCSPERKFYWITTALSFTDARANALPLLMPTRELVEILLTRAEFEEQIRAMADFPIEDQRLPPELLMDPAQALIDLFGPENLLRQFPVAEPALAHFLQTVLDYDADRYADLLREGFRGLDYQENHPDEWETLTEEPVLLEALEPIEVLPEDVSGELEEIALPEDLPVALVPVSAPPLARLTAPLSPARQARVSEELQDLYVRQAIAEGGSFLLSDLERVAQSVQAYLLLGIQAEAGGRTEREGLVLALRPLHKVSQSGARVVEGLRQIAHRIRPLNEILSVEQRALVRSLVHPRLSVGSEGRPVMFLMPGGNLPDSADLPGVTALLQDAAIWTEIVRALGVERVTEALRGGATLEAVQEQLALAAVLYARVELGLVEPADLERYGRRYPQGDEPGPAAAARESLRRTVAAWAGTWRIPPEGAVRLFDVALERVAQRAAMR